MRTFIQELLEAGCLFLIVFLALHFSVQNFRIDGRSMHPTLIDEQHLIASKLAYSRINPAALLRFIPVVDKANASPSFVAPDRPGYGDVIAFTYPLDPSRSLVKRVVGIPGDIIEIERGQVIRNGVRLRESYITHRDGRTFAPLEVPPDSYYVLGDNRRASTDSRAWGFVSDEHIIGRAWLSYWPSDRFEFLHPLW